MFYISQKNWNKILGYAEEAYDKHKSEIGGMSVMIEDKEGDWELQEPVILKQEISGGNTVLDKDALAVYYTKEAKKMGNKNFRFCWWHSHHTMNAFWSSTDLTAIDEFEDGDFSFALVVNLKGEYKFRVSVWKPVEAHQDVDLDIMRPSRCNKNMTKEVEALCEKATFGHSKEWKKNSYGGYGYTYGIREGLKDREEDPRQERLPFRTTAGQTTSYGDRFKMSFTEIVDEVDDINSEAIEGSVDYKEYKLRIDDLNATLKKEDNMYSVELIPENKLDSLLHMYPNQMVVYDTTKEAVYDRSYYEMYGL